jgi:hypothetical protein
MMRTSVKRPQGDETNIFYPSFPSPQLTCSLDGKSNVPAIPFSIKSSISGYVVC